MKYYTYAHYTADTKELFYIGKGTAKRAYSEHSRNVYWRRKVAKHGFTVVVLAFWKTEDEAYSHEKTLLNTFKSLGYKLCNIASGGKGGMSGLPNPATGKANRSRVWSEESKRKLSSSLTGRKMPDSFKEKTSKRLKGVSKTAQHRHKLAKALSKNKIECVTTGVIYDTLFEAAESTKSDRSHILKCCKGIQKTHNKFTWRFA
jgi:hypothetical protein